MPKFVKMPGLRIKGSGMSQMLGHQMLGDNVKPIFGANKSRDGKLLPNMTNRGSQQRMMPPLSGIDKGGYKSVASVKGANGLSLLPSGLSSDFHAT